MQKSNIQLICLHTESTRSFWFWVFPGCTEGGWGMCQTQA